MLQAIVYLINARYAINKLITIRQFKCHVKPNMNGIFTRVGYIDKNSNIQCDSKDKAF